MKRSISTLLLIFVCMLVLTACKNDKEVAGEEVTEQETEVQTYTYGYSCIDMNNPYFEALESSLREHLEKEGHTLITKDAASDAKVQAQQIEELITEGIDAVYLSPVDWIEIEESVDKLKEAGIKIINLDTQIQAFDKVDAYIGSDNSNAGYLCGQDLIERLPDGGKILIIEYPSRNSVNERIKGFEKAIAKKGYDIAARLNAKGDLENALTLVEDALKTYPDISAIMCGSDPTALGALVAVQGAGRNDIIIYGIDGSPDVKKELAKDQSSIVATVGQSTKKMALEAATVGMKMLNGEKYERKIYIETFLITHDNVAEYGIDTWQ